MSADPEIEKVFPALQRVIVTIHTTDGREFSTQLDYPKGDPRNPLTDKEVEEKFEALAEPGDVARCASPGHRRDLDTWRSRASVTELMKLCSRPTVVAGGQ